MTKKIIANMLIIALFITSTFYPFVVAEGAKTITGEVVLAGLDISIVHGVTTSSSITSTQAAIVTKSAIEKSATKSAISKKYKYDIRYTKCTLNLRKKPTAKSKIKKVLPIGTKVKRIYVRADGWTKVKVKVKGKKGFVKNKYLSKKRPKVVKKSDTKLKGVRKANADRIAKVCIDNYKTYGVLPSVSVAQAFIETGIGTAYNNGNLWGLCSNNFGGYSSIEIGCLAYLRCINNGYYEGAPFEKDYQTQITKILYGGYCENPADYISKVIWVIQTYDLTDYDKYI